MTKNKNGKTRLVQNPWTKEDMKKLILLWEEKSLEDLGEEIGRTRAQILDMARKMRKENINLPVKKKKGVINGLILEVKKELKIK